MFTVNSAPFLKLCMLCLLSTSFSLLSTSAHLSSASVPEQGSRGTGIEREVLFSKANANAINTSNSSPTPIFVDRAGEETCSTDDIEIEQGPLATLPSGIPTYMVQIVNVCVSGCSISNIHISCGWFSSATLVDPNIFKRLSYDDCLVNAGEPLAAGQSLSFHYSNTRSYPLSVSSVAC